MNVFLNVFAEVSSGLAKPNKGWLAGLTGGRAAGNGRLARKTCPVCSPGGDKLPQSTEKEEK